MTRRRKATVCTLRPVGSDHWLHSTDAYMRDAIPRLLNGADAVASWLTLSAVEMRLAGVLIESDKQMHAAMKRLRAAVGRQQFRTAALYLRRTWAKFYADETAKLTAASVTDFGEARRRLLAAGWQRRPVAPDLVATARRRERLAACKRIERYA